MSDDAGIMERWGVSSRTLQNWRVRGEEVGEAPPLAAEDPGALVEWYRRHFGREPHKKVREAAARMRAALHTAEATPAAGRAGDGANPWRLPEAGVIAEACSRLGLSLTLARMAQEEERAWLRYEAARRAQSGDVDAARRAWKEITEAKRAAQKTEDAVQVALELFKAWVRTEWEPQERIRREALAGKKLGLQAREALLTTGTELEWVAVWDDHLDRALDGAENVEALSSGRSGD